MAIVIALLYSTVSCKTIVERPVDFVLPEAVQVSDITPLSRGDI